MVAWGYGMKTRDWLQWSVAELQQGQNVLYLEWGGSWLYVSIHFVCWTIYTVYFVKNCILIKLIKKIKVINTLHVKSYYDSIYMYLRFYLAVSVGLLEFIYALLAIIVEAKLQGNWPGLMGIFGHLTELRWLAYKERLS